MANETRDPVLIFYQILSTYSLRKCVAISLEICMWISIGA